MLVRVMRILSAPPKITVIVQRVEHGHNSLAQPPHYAMELGIE